MGHFTGSSVKINTQITNHAVALSPPQLTLRPQSPSPSRLSRKRPASPPSGALQHLSESVPDNLGELIDRDVCLLRRLGWAGLIARRRPRDDFSSLADISHPARRLLSIYKSRGAPVRFSTAPWTPALLKRAISRGPHKSCHDHIAFLHDEFFDMINRGQWIILPYTEIAHLPGLRISPPGVVPQRERRPRWICDYSWWGVNDDTLPLAAMEAMQFGHTLDRVLREILLADPAFGPVQLIKLDISDGFYRIGVAVDDIPRLGVIFPTPPGAAPLVAFPLVLPMGWTNSPPIFSTATETIADIANARLRHSVPPLPHHLDDLADSIQLPPPPRVLTPHIPRDPCLPTQRDPLSYVDVFVDDFIGAGQQPDNCRRIRRSLLHAVDSVFRPLDSNDHPLRQEPVSMKKLRAGDCTWSTCKQVLGWIINTASNTIHLPPHRVTRLHEILASIPHTQRRISKKRWHQILGELRSMSLALPGSRNIFSTMQNALSSALHGRVALSRGVHDAVADFKWMADNVAQRPTRIAELVPLLPSAVGHHDASGTGAGGVWFPAAHICPRGNVTPRQPIVWRHQWSQEITNRLITDTNRNGSLTNSDLELAGGLIHLDVLSQCFDTRERTVLSLGDNLSTTFWERRGSTSTSKPPAYLLRLFGIHQRLHRYVPRFDYISGTSNHVADALSRLFQKSWSDLTLILQPFLPQPPGFQVSTPSQQIISAVTSALLRKRCSVESLQAAPLAPKWPGINGCTSQLTWASTPFCKPSTTRFPSFKSSPNEFILENLQPEAIPSSLGWLKIT